MKLLSLLLTIVLISPSAWPASLEYAGYSPEDSGSGKGQRLYAAYQQPTPDPIKAEDPKQPFDKVPLAAGGQQIPDSGTRDIYLIAGNGSDYTLGPDDRVQIEVRNQPDFSGNFKVDPFGNIQIPFLGDIPAAGHTKFQLQQNLIDSLKAYVHYPEVSVVIAEYRSKAVYIYGYVNHPGKFNMMGDRITVKEAIVAAGLPREDAKSEVMIVRPSQYTPDGKPQHKRVNLNKLLMRGESSEDFILQPGDSIVVGQKFFDKFLNTYTRIIGPIFQTAALVNLVEDIQDEREEDEEDANPPPPQQPAPQPQPEPQPEPQPQPQPPPTTP